MRWSAAVALAALSALAFAQAPDGTPASALIGTEVLDRRGEHLGELKDLIFDARDGTVLQITVEYGRWLRVGEHEAAFSPASFSRHSDGLVLDVSEQGLRRAPAFERPAWPQIRATRLIGREVRDRLHRDSGEMVDLTIDLAGGRVRQAVLDLGDDWERGERLLHLPIEDFSLPRDVGQFATLKVKRERLPAP